MTGRLVSLTLLLAAIGCFAPTPPFDDSYDPVAAYDTLAEALEAWKTGEIRSLATLDSPIRFADDDLAAGFQLVDYEINLPATDVRPYADTPVTLTLKRSGQEPFERQALYQIALEPTRAVLRSDS